MERNFSARLSLPTFSDIEKTCENVGQGGTGSENAPKGVYREINGPMFD